MKSTWKRILPILLVIVALCSIAWYLFVYDRAFTKDMLIHHARYFEQKGKQQIAAWLYDAAYMQSGNSEDVAIELSELFKSHDNYSKAEHTLSRAISDNPTVNLYIALCNIYLEQNKVLDAVTMLDSVSDPTIKAQLDQLRPAAPTPSAPPGFYTQYITVQVQCKEGTLYVSGDGTYPSLKNDSENNSIQLTGGINKIYALSIGDNGLVSPLSIFTYTVGGVIEEVNLSNSALDRLVRETLNLTDNYQLLTSDLWKITSLVFPENAESINDLQYFPYLKELTIQGGSYDNTNILSYLNNLEKLTISHVPLTSQDLRTIASMSHLTELTLSYCSISSIQDLAGAQKLVYLDLNNNIIRDITALSTMTDLITLDISHNAVESLTTLSQLVNLKDLNVANNDLASLVPLASCTALEKVNVSNNKIGTLSGIENLKNLYQIVASGNNLTDLDILANSTQLTHLTVSNNSLQNITVVTKLNKLQHLDFSHNEVSKFPQWTTDNSLVEINGSNNKISSISNLTNCKMLNVLILKSNKVSNIDKLTKCPEISKIDVTSNPVKKVSKLTELGIIVIYTP